MRASTNGEPAYEVGDGRRQGVDGLRHAHARGWYDGGTYLGVRIDRCACGAVRRHGVDGPWLVHGDRRASK